MDRQIRIKCSAHGTVNLSDEQYRYQLWRENDSWKCPHCMLKAEWDGIYYQCPGCGDWREESEFACGSCGFDFVSYVDNDTVFVPANADKNSDG